jgi:hypothetical protein
MTFSMTYPGYSAVMMTPVREAVGEVVQIGEVDPRQRAGQRHRIAPGLYLAASG